MKCLKCSRIGEEDSSSFNATALDTRRGTKRQPWKVSGMFFYRIKYLVCPFQVVFPEIQADITRRMESSKYWLKRGRNYSAVTRPKLSNNNNMICERGNMIWARDGGHEEAVEHTAFLLSNRKQSKPNHAWI